MRMRRDADSMRPHPGAEATRGEARRRLERKIDELPAACRTAFVLCAIEGMSPREAGEILDLSPTAVRSRVLRARRLLGRSLRNELHQALAEVFIAGDERCARIVRGVLSKLGDAPPSD
jgi:RNA polymerase sigma-70 factor (ECF subfamily)